MFLSLLFREKHCNMADIVIRSTSAFISTLLVDLLKIFPRITELKSGNYGGKFSPIGIRVTLNKEKR